MKLSARTAAWLLPLMLTACFHRHQQAKNPPTAPPLSNPPIATTRVDLPPSADTIPPQPTRNAKAPTEERPKPHHRRPKAQPQAPAQEEVANVAVPPAVSAIGQLSSGDPVDVRRETEESIISIDKTLSGIHRPLSDSEQKTAEHIREFIKEARAALASGDVDGARTLAAKAKVLLAELTK